MHVCQCLGDTRPGTKLETKIPKKKKENEFYILMKINENVLSLSLPFFFFKLPN